MFLTLDTVRGMLKSLPPCSLKPQGAGPLRVTEYKFIALEKTKEERFKLESQEEVSQVTRPFLLYPNSRVADCLLLFPTEDVCCVQWHSGDFSQFKMLNLEKFLSEESQRYKY